MIQSRFLGASIFAKMLREYPCLVSNTDVLRAWRGRGIIGMAVAIPLTRPKLSWPFRRCAPRIQGLRLRTPSSIIRQRLDRTVVATAVLSSNRCTQQPRQFFGWRTGLNSPCVILYLLSRYRRPERPWQRLRRCRSNGGGFLHARFSLTAD